MHGSRVGLPSVWNLPLANLPHLGCQIRLTKLNDRIRVHVVAWQETTLSTCVHTSGWSASGYTFLYCKKNLKISTPFNTNTGLFPALVIQNMVISGNHLQLAQHQELGSASVGYWTLKALTKSDFGVWVIHSAHRPTTSARRNGLGA